MTLHCRAVLTSCFFDTVDLDRLRSYGPRASSPKDRVLCRGNGQMGHSGPRNLIEVDHNTIGPTNNCDMYPTVYTCNACCFCAYKCL